MQATVRCPDDLVERCRISLHTAPPPRHGVIKPAPLWAGARASYRRCAEKTSAGEQLDVVRLESSVRDEEPMTPTDGLDDNRPDSTAIVEQRACQ
jgi:hypothetical protein